MKSRTVIRFGLVVLLLAGLVVGAYIVRRIQRANQTVLTLSLDEVPVTVDLTHYNHPCPAEDDTNPLSDDYHTYLEAPQTQLDSSGVIIRDYRGALNQYSPTTIAAFGRSALGVWCRTREKLALQLAVNQADWLVKNAVHIKDFITWYFNFPNPDFFAPAPWSSGLTNGQIIYLLTEMYAVSGDSKYDQAAKQALNSFLVDIKEGGVSSTYADGAKVFEEVANPAAPNTFILNGHMLAVQSLAYYAEYSHDATAARLVDEGIQAVRDQLPNFDRSVIAAYSLGPVPWGSSRSHYAHGIHIRGLFWMYQHTNDPIFLRYALDWQHYKWPAIPANLYKNVVSEDNLINANPDDQRWVIVPRDTQSFILDLQKVQPVHSFGYNMVGPYPTQFTLSISTDGSQWEDIQTHSDVSAAHGLYLLGDPSTRYIRFSMDALSDDPPFYAQIRDGAYANTLSLGVTRADNLHFWQDPILLVTQGTLAFDESQVLSDSDPATTLDLPSDSVMYVDLRESKSVSSLQVEGTDSAARKIGFEASADMKNWEQVGDSVQASLPGTVIFPQGDKPYQFWRIHFDGSDPLTMSAITIQ